MAAKDKIETGFRVSFDDQGGTARDLSGDLVPGSLTGGGYTFDTAEMTGVSNDVKNFFSTWASSEVTAQFHMNDTATTGATTVLNGYTPTLINGGGTLTLQWGIAGAVPTTGDPEWEGEYVLTTNTIQPSSGKFVHQVTFMPLANAAAPAWGTVA